jgi:hypothetical protein
LGFTSQVKEAYRVALPVGALADRVEIIRPGGTLAVPDATAKVWDATPLGVGPAAAGR